MKKYIILTLLLSSFLIVEATIHNVDNNANSPSGYSKNLQATIENASAGDTIYVYPSNIDYGNITIKKKLYLFGSGYDGTTGAVTKISYLYLDTATTPSSNPSGSSIQGFTFEYYLNCNKSNISNIVVAGNYFSYYSTSISLGSNCTSWLITNNYIYGAININNNTSVVITNNVFKGHSNSINTSNSSSVVISNNLFMQWQYFDNVYNATISNNIFICNSNSYTGSTMSNNIFNNNISYCSNASHTYNLPPTGNTGTGNLQNQNPAFVSGSTNSSYNYSEDYHLQSSSVGKNAGTDGTDIGQYGGTKPFVWKGALSIPQVYQMSVSNPIINQGTTINVNVKAKKADL